MYKESDEAALKGRVSASPVFWKLTHTDTQRVEAQSELLLYSESSLTLTLKEWRFNLSFSCILKAHSHWHSKSGGSIWASPVFWKLTHTDTQRVEAQSELLLYSESSLTLTLKEWRLNLSFSCILKAHSHWHSKSGGSIWASPVFWKLTHTDTQRVEVQSELLYMSVLFLNTVAGGLRSHTVGYDTNTLKLFKKLHWHSREAQIEPPPFEFEWAFRIQAFVFAPSLK